MAIAHLEIRPTDSIGRWSKEDLMCVPNFRNGPPRGNEPGKVRGILLGAGLSRAAAKNVELPTWSDLIQRLATALDVTVVSDDTATAAFQLSRARSALEIQAAVTRELKRSAVDEVEIDEGIAAALQDVIARTRCDLIIDLNYDGVAEKILRKGGLSYYRIVGSQVDVVAPLPFERHLVLWKIHGSIEEGKQPTIVLSPRDYEQIYRSNDLEKNLKLVASKLTELVTIGVGLTDDEQWRALGSRDLEIIAVWLSSKWKANEAADELKPWQRVVTARRCTVLSAPIPTQKGDFGLAERLHELADSLDPVDMPVRRVPVVKPSVFSEWHQFDQEYGAAVDLPYPESQDTVSRVIGKYERAYNNLLQTLTTWTGSGPGRRSLAAIGSDCLRGPMDELRSERVAADLASILRNAHEIYKEYSTKWLVLCCAQELVRMVLDLVEILRLGSIDMKTPEVKAPILQRGTVLVGSNPFSVSDRSRYNALHRFEVKEECRIDYPIYGVTTQSEGGAGAAQLLTEDAWEARMVTLYLKSGPLVRLGEEAIGLDWVPPLYPWGFNSGGLAEYRKRAPGTVTRAWHLVDDRHDHGGRGLHQVCKGGSLRDTDIASFKLSYRGYVRVGELDDFTQHAPA